MMKYLLAILLFASAAEAFEPQPSKIWLVTSTETTRPPRDRALYWEYRPQAVGETTIMPARSTTPYVMQIQVSGYPENIPYKIRWLGHPTWQAKSGTNWVTKRDTTTIMGLREDGFVVYRSSP